MSNLSETIDRLCESRGIKGSKMCDDLGMSRSFLTELRKGRAKSITFETAQKIADYFGISVSELTDEPTKKSTENESVDNEYDEVMRMREDIRRNPKLKVLFSLSRKATPEDLEKTLKVIRAICGDEDDEYNY